MAMDARHRVSFRRRREGKTDYRARLALIKSNLPRAVVRRTLKNINIQFIEYDVKGDRVLVAATATELKKFGWTRSTSNVSAAYLAGWLAGKRALQKGIESAVLDMGLRRPSRGNKTFAALKGLLDAGVEIPHGEGIFPSEDRIQGTHINAQDDFEKVMTSLKEAMK